MPVSPMTSMMTGASEGFRETRETQQKREDERHKQALAMYQDLISQGFKPVNRKEGTHDGSLVRVGQMGFLAPPKIDKEKMFEMKMQEQEVRLETAKASREIQELQNEALKARLDAQVKNSYYAYQKALAEGNTAKVNAAKRQLDKRIKEIELAKAQEDRQAAANKAEYAQKTAELEYDMKKMDYETKVVESDSKTNIAKLKRDEAIANYKREMGIEGELPLEDQKKVASLQKTVSDMEVGMMDPNNKSVAPAQINNHAGQLALINPDARYVMAERDGGGLFGTGTEIDKYYLPEVRQKDGSWRQLTIKDVVASLEKGQIMTVQEAVNYWEKLRASDAKGEYIRWHQESSKAQGSKTSPNSSGQLSTGKGKGKKIPALPEDLKVRLDEPLPDM